MRYYSYDYNNEPYDDYGHDSYGYEPYSGWLRHRRNPRKKSLAKAKLRKQKRLAQQAPQGLKKPRKKRVPKRTAPASFAPPTSFKPIVTEGVWQAPTPASLPEHDYTQLRMGIPFDVAILREESPFDVGNNKWDELGFALKDDPEIREQIYRSLLENLCFDVDGEMRDSIDIDIETEARGAFTLTLEIPRDIQGGGWKSYGEGRTDALADVRENRAKKQSKPYVEHFDKKDFTTITEDDSYWEYEKDMLPWRGIMPPPAQRNFPH